jgi:hypothetical protein
MPKYNLNLIKSRKSYDIEEIVSLFGVSRKTCSRWIKCGGLKVVEKDVRPLLIMGVDLDDFIRKKRLKQKKPLEEDEYFCFKCHKQVRAKIGSEQEKGTGKKIGRDNKEQMRKIAICGVCGTEVNKYVGVSRRN